MTRIAVIDVETTGLYPSRNNRIVELAAVVINLEGKIVAEFETLINPQRDIGPTHVHGLVSRDINNAPIFGEIIGDFLSTIDGCVALAGHNVQFDYSFLEAEFSRCGFPFPETPMLCTMQMAGGGSLSRSCKSYGVEFDGRQHSAYFDAKASARLLTLFLKDSYLGDSELSSMPPINWPGARSLGTNLVTRTDSLNKETQTPAFLKRLMNNASPAVTGLSNRESYYAYTDLLNRVLEDRVIDEEESEALVGLATKCGLPIKELESAHLEYLSQLAKAAWADGVVTEAEQRDLVCVSELLGIGPKQFESVLEKAKQDQGSLQVQQHDSCSEFRGKRVCFTGACQCVVDGERVTRSSSYALAEERGMISAKSVTKKLDFLVVADPYTQSGKAQKARQYGTRIIQARVFWRALGFEVT